jgi:radical SAM superfamily enzyme YgiQ (UPF0313 family)
MKREETKMKKQKPKLLIIVLFQNLIDEEPYYALTPAPPLPGILLAGMTPDIVNVEVLHEMVRPIDYNANADFIAISFMDYLAPHAYQVAEKFRKMGKVVVGGGKFISTFPELAEGYFDSILIGEAQNVWPQMVRDMVNHKLHKRYYSDPSLSLKNIPAPRYDLVESKFTVPIVTEASRSCPHSCTYCQLSIEKLPYRTRPVEDVINDLKNIDYLPWHKRKFAMIHDNHLGGNLKFAKDLLREIAKLKFWAVGVQFSIECLRDREFVDLLAASRCRMAFIGMESLNTKSLNSVDKKQNKVEEYKNAFDELHKRGILTFTGLMFALDEDTAEYYNQLPKALDEVGNCVILSSIAIPLYGTPLYHKMIKENRITDYNISHYEGDHLVFRHKYLTETEIYSAYKNVNRIFYSWNNIIKRWYRIMKKQRIMETVPAFILKLFVVSFVYFKLSIFQRHHAQKRVFKYTACNRDNVLNPLKQDIVPA